jgi:hypothetical protein
MESSFVGRYANASEGKFQFRLRQDNTNADNSAGLPNARRFCLATRSTSDDASAIIDA